MEALSPWEQVQGGATSSDDTGTDEFEDRLGRLMLQEELVEARRQLRQHELCAGGRSWRLLAASGWLLAFVGWAMFLCGGAPSEMRLPAGVSALATWTSPDYLVSTMQEESGQRKASWQRRLIGNSSSGSSSSSRRLIGNSSSSGISGGTSTSGSSTSAASSNSGSSGSSGADHSSHPHDGMYFLLLAMGVGLLITAITSMDMFHSLPQTVALFLAGVVTAALMENLPPELIHTSVQHSWNMWMTIDPHLLLFTMLPSLLMADAMTIDTQVAARVAKQCIYLAGPGVAISSFIVAFFLWAYLPYNWPFLLCLTSGSILCATDPVAVVALLKELGASPVLTVQIQGEALLNDGTAIVLFIVTYSMLKGQVYDVSEFFIVLLRMALLAIVVGTIFGAVFYYWIKRSGNKFDHNSAVVQTLLTVSCCYWSFCVSEGLLGVSGVLACVASALMLAYKMWPTIVDKASLLSFWHVFETLCNTVIFYLAGALTGKAMVSVDAEDYGHLFVLYLFLMVSRLVLLLCSLPILKHLSPEKTKVTIAEAMVMTWGGLRGAVGLSLAIQVANDKGGGAISEKDSQRVLFYVGGIAALTLVINATTCPFLVNALGITRLPKAKQSLLLIIHNRIKEKANSKKMAKSVTCAINTVLEEVHDSIEGMDTENEERISRVGSRKSTRASTRQSVRKSVTNSVAKGLAKLGRVEEVEIMDSDSVISAYQRAYQEFLPIGEKDGKESSVKHQIHTAFDTIRSMPFTPDFLSERYSDLLRTAGDINIPLVRAFNEAFFKLVKHEYWHLIDERLLPSQSDGEQLLLSLLMAQSSPPYELLDLQALMRLDDESRSSLVKQKSSQTATQSGFQQKLSRFLDSILFNIVMTLLIVASCVVSGVEDSIATKNENELLNFFVLECFFMFVFTVECTLKLVNMKCRFFSNFSNVFDAILVVLGGVGIWLGYQELTEEAASISSLSATTEVGSQSRLIRVARIFRVLRLVRLVRLYRLYMTIKAKLSHEDISFELANHLRRIALLEAFVKAHVKSQKAMLGYFCMDDKLTSPELARLLIQSQTCVFKATKTLHQEENHVGKRTLRAVKTLRDSMAATREVEEFVIHAHHAGILGSVETESLLHPVHEHMAHFKSQIGRAFEGWTGESARPNEEDQEGSDSDSKSQASEDQGENRVLVQDAVLTLPPDCDIAADRESPRVTPEGQNGSVSTADPSHLGSKASRQQELENEPSAPLSILPGTPHMESRKAEDDVTLF